MPRHARALGGPGQAQPDYDFIGGPTQARLSPLEANLGKSQRSTPPKLGLIRAEPNPRQARLARQKI